MQKKDRVESAAREYLNAHRIDPSSGILVACSGGPDSMCLLTVLNDIHNGPIGCMYYEHGIRDTSETAKERELVSHRSADLGIPFHLESAPAGRIEREAQTQGIGIEAAARNARYGALYRVAHEKGYPYIATGHNEDDHIETVLMRVFTGSGPDGLKGIPSKRDNVLRPLICVPKGEIRAYLSANGVPWITDPTNESDMFLRNTIRNNILPVITEYVPSARAGILSVAEKMDATAAALDTLISRSISWTRHDDEIQFRAAEFEDLPVAARYRFLLGLWNDLGTQGGIRIPHRFFHPISLPQGIQVGDGVVLRGYGAVLARNGDLFALKSEVVPAPVYSYLFRVRPGCSYPVGSLTLAVGEGGDGLQGETALTVRSSELSQPVILRNRRPGDVIRLSSGTKPVKKLLNEWNVPHEERWTLPIIEDRIGLVAVLEGKAGGRVAFRSKISADGALFDDGTVWTLSLSNTEINSEHAK